MQVHWRVEYIPYPPSMQSQTCPAFLGDLDLACVENRVQDLGQSRGIGWEAAAVTPERNGGGLEDG